MTSYDVSANLPAGLSAARDAVTRGEVICVPTDTVYGIGADPFSYDAVTALLSAKSRTRAMPPPVLVASVAQTQTLVADLPESARALMTAFWPGALTIILPAREELGWDLGETNGTVALRMPDSTVTLTLLESTGPLAVTSANKTGQPPAVTAREAHDQLGDAVSVYLDGGASSGGVPSTIVRWNEDDRYDVVRMGAIGINELAAVVEVAN